MVFTALLLGLCWFHQVSGAQHSLQYFYTGSTGIKDLPQFIAVGMVDGRQIDWYDSNSRKNMLKQPWMEGVRDENGITQIRQGAEESFKNNIQIVMSRFNQTAGVHVFQRMYGCQWNDKSGETDGYNQYGYDGEDFLSMDLKNMQYIAPVTQAFPTKQKWESNTAVLQQRKHYFNQICIEWLKKYVDYGRTSQEMKVPKVSLLQKDSPVVCHATGFYPDGVMITWKRDGEEVLEDVDVGETLPNEDGTFQKRSVLKMSPEERKKGQYTCEVTHNSGKPQILILEEGNNLLMIIGVCVIIAVVFAIVVGAVVFIRRKKDYAKASQCDSSSDGSGAQKA